MDSVSIWKKVQTSMVLKPFWLIAWQLANLNEHIEWWAEQLTLRQTLSPEEIRRLRELAHVYEVAKQKGNINIGGLFSDLTSKRTGE